MLSDLAKPIAFWSPLPPAKSGISDYSFELLEHMKRKCSLVAVIDDQYYKSCKPPTNIEIIKASSYIHSEFSTNIFQLGNHFGFHGYMYKPLLEYGGITVLHDLSLFDFHVSLCNSVDSSILMEEILFDSPDLKSSTDLYKKLSDCQHDRLAYPLLRRIADASNLIIVHSKYAKQFIEKKYRTDVRHIHQGILGCNNVDAESGELKIVLGMFGSIAKHKNTLEVLKAFIKARSKNHNIKLLIAGRVDDPNILNSINRTIASLPTSIQEDVEIHTNLSYDQLQKCIARCDLQILLRWPTAGETSRVLLHGFTMGKPALISPLPQWLEYPNEFCWPIGNDPRTTTVEDIADKILEATSDKKKLLKSGVLAKQWAEDNLDWDAISSQLLKYTRSNSIAVLNKVEKNTLETPDLNNGINVIAALDASTGLAEAARRSIKALYQSGIPLSVSNYDLGVPTNSKNVPSEIANLKRGLIFPDINICYLNINELHCLDKSLFFTTRKGQKLITSWWWEATQIPNGLIQLITELHPDAITVGSNFVKDILMTFFPFPTYVVPPVVNVEYDSAIKKQRFGIPENKLVYLVSFDANSSFQRKNPIGAIEAYKRASLEHITDSVLVVKASNLEKYPEARQIIQAKLASVNGVLIEDHITAKEMGSLLSLADIYISLHRSEGFGLGMAESMYLGKPVIGTSYSGNIDFLNNDTGCPVSYKLVEINRGDLYLNSYLDYAELQAPKGKHSYWAEPNLDDATKWIQELARSESLREKLGKAGKQFIVNNYNSKIHAEKIHHIIKQIM